MRNYKVRWLFNSGSQHQVSSSPKQQEGAGMNTLVGRKVKMLPHCLFYRNDGGSNVGVIHKVVDVPHWNDNQGNTVVMVTDGAVMMPCYPHELRYLNNREVVLDE